MRIRGNSRFSSRTSKRKNEEESSTVAASEPQPKRMSRRNEGGQKEPSSSKTRDVTVSSSVQVDKYCWICHTETDDKICITCNRAFHDSCIKKKKYAFNELGACIECHSKSVKGTELSFNKFFSPDKLKRMLDVLTRRSFDKKRKKNELFLRWKEEGRDKLYKIIDFEILLDNINHVLPYTKTAEFYGDVKFIYHNSCIVHGANSEHAKAAESLRRDFKTELLDLEACPECYYHIYCDESDYCEPFIRLCDSPHDIVWAQLTGHSYWPAKCLKVVKGVAHVRFFGTHEQSNIPIKKCYFMSESHPKYKNSSIFTPENSGPKLESYRTAIIELLRYIRLYEIKYGDFPFCSSKTLYKPKEKQNEVIIAADGSLSRNVVQMKLEGIGNEDSETNVINAASVMGFPEENLQFPNSGTDDISPNDSFKEIYLKSLHPDGNGNLVGQYPTPEDLLSDVDVDASFLAQATADSGLSTDPSRVTSIDMSFSSEENPSNVPTNPVVTSIQSLELPEQNFNNIENFKGILHSEASVQHTVSSSMDCNSFMDTQAELDNEVQCIGEKINTQDDSVNPNLILPILEESNPELKVMIQQVRYFINGFLINLWASCTQKPDSLSRLSKMSVDLRKSRSALKNLEEEIINFKKEEAVNKFQMQTLNEKIRKLESEKKNLENQVEQEILTRNKVETNAKFIVESLKTDCYRRIEEKLRKQLMDTITEKEKKAEDAERMMKILEEEKRQLKKELEEANISLEKLYVTKSLECVYGIDDIKRFKKNHFCTVCDVPAAVTCCLNTSYCSIKCQELDAEKHRPDCEQPQMSSQIVKETVCQETILSYEEMSTINKSSNSQEISATNSIASSSHHQKTDISASTMLPTTIASFPRSSKSKRRFHK